MIDLQKLGIVVGVAVALAKALAKPDHCLCLLLFVAFVVGRDTSTIESMKFGHYCLVGQAVLLGRYFFWLAEWTHRSQAA